MKAVDFHLVQLATGILFMSTSGVLGRYISLPAPVIIWIRCLVCVVLLYAILKLLKKSVFIGWGRHFRIVILSSLFLGAHWITYFMSLQLSNVAVSMLSMFTYPVMTALLEPLVLKTRFNPVTILLSIFAFIGVSFLVPELDFGNTMTQGILLGLFAGFFYSLRNLLLKMNINEHDGITLMYYQVIILSLLLWPVMFMYEVSIPEIEINDWMSLLALGVLTTAIGHTLFTRSLKHFTVSTVSIMSCLTPLLGAGLAYVFLDEIPRGQTFVAGTIIMLTAIYESYRSVKVKKQSI